MENPPFEDVFPIQDGDFPASYVCIPEGTSVGAGIKENPYLPPRITCATSPTS